MAKILVVDDAEFMRMRLSKLLSSNGYDVIEAEHGEAGVEKYTQNKPNLVLMDITMPILDGIRALQQIMELDPKANVVMCSALGQKTMVIEAIKSGAKDFIVKPYDPEKILETVAKYAGA